ncbi:hypothetical protein NHX12_015097 [Muraenolepis orangiensis]|uniref:Uncharacterized protein n=1 Tax=Muraenolepis orangiensis TaxID=630683 RepID=A0A9Q0DA94_9TELE|nr:hypothetical protein NHX12_015097 [Muraenolepis orangiensis]
MKKNLPCFSRKVCVYYEPIPPYPYSEMQQSVRSGEQATVAVQFTDLPNALIACKVDVDLFDDNDVKYGVVVERLPTPVPSVYRTAGSLAIPISIYSKLPPPDSNSGPSVQYSV